MKTPWWINALAALAAGLFVTFILFIISAPLALIVRWTWNTGLHDIWPIVPMISWFQAWKLMVLSGLLLKSSGGSSNSKET